MTSLLKTRYSRLETGPCSARQILTIGLINNMPDEALRTTERQFADLVGASAGDIDIRLRVFALDRVPRSPGALGYLRARYEPASALLDTKIDALIITGAQPRAVRLSDEPYWRELTELIDWAKDNTRSTVFSCLAAHAGVLHLDGIERRPLPEKCFGVFAFTGRRDHPFVGKQGRPRLIPHSRYNGLLQSDLERAGYDILASSPVHGVDSFAKTAVSQFVFLQGHPEYDANSLAHEYRRDMGRYLRGDLERAPSIPAGYFNLEAEAELSALERRARDGQRQLLLQELSKIDALAPPQAEWRGAAVSFYRNWIGSIVASTFRKPVRARKAELSPLT